MSKLTGQQEELSAEEESVRAKKKPTPLELQELQKVQQATKRHAWHIQKMEQLLRKMDNDGIDLDELGATRESVEYYVDDWREEEFFFDEELYAVYNLDEVEKE